MTTKEDDLTDRAYLLFMRWQCEAFFVALHRANDSFEKVKAHYNAAPWGTPQLQAFSDLQSALEFAANVAKMLWPHGLRPKESAAARARLARLGTLLGIISDPVLNDVELRNDMEHVDTRVDVWAANSTQNNLLLNYVGSDSLLAGLDRTDLFTRYDPVKRRISMLSHAVDLDKLEASVKSVHEKVLASLEEIERRLAPP